MQKHWLTTTDYLFLGAAVLSLIAACVVVSDKKLFWNDELYSWYLLSDPSFGHMWRAFADKINNTPPLYFLLGWSWARLFSPSELSLRLFSSLGFCAALIVVWTTLRRHYGLWPVAVASLGVFCTSRIIFEQNAEARMYGLFLAVAAAALAVYDAICRRRAPSAGLLGANFLIHAALIHTHLHGAFFSGAILAAAAAYDRLFGAPRPRVYASVVLSWLTFLLYLPAFLVQAEAGNPRSWMPEPTFEDLTGLYASSNAFVHSSVWLIVIALSALALWSSAARAPDEEVQPAAPGNRSHLLIFALALLAVPTGVWMISRIGKPVFFGKYLLPAALGYVVLLVHFCDNLFVFHYRWPRNILTAIRSSGLPVLLGLFCLGLPASLLLRAVSDQRGRIIGEVHLPAAHKNLPVVCQMSQPFHQFLFYAEEPERYFFILDREAAMDPKSGRFGAQEYKHMVALRDRYQNYFNGQILESEAFLSRYSRFLVLDYPEYDKPCVPRPKGLAAAEDWKDLHCPQWLEYRILTNPAYRVTPLGGGDYWSTFLLVERVAGE